MVSARKTGIQNLASAMGAIWLAAIFLLPPLAYAQNSAANLRAKIVDENAEPVADATVRIETAGSEHRTIQSDALGRVAAGGLAVGPVRITVTKAGFFQLTLAQTTLVEGANELSLTMHHEQEVHEKVEVTSTSLGIDPVQTTQHDSLVAHEILDVPVPATHELSTALVAMPQVVVDNSAELHFAGARTGDTEYVLDGFEIGNPSTGAFDIHVPVDSVRTADLASARYGAEYSHAGAGVLSLETDQGDDRWRFGTTNFIPGVKISGGLHFGNWYPRVSLSGPIHKGRAWFSDTATVEHTLIEISGLPAGQNLVTQWLGYNLARVTVKFTEHQTLEASFLYDQSAEPNNNLGPFMPLSTTSSVSSKRGFVAAKDQMWLRSVLVQFGVAGDIGKTSSTPQGTSAFVVGASGFSGNYFQSLTGIPKRIQANTDVLFPERHWHGNHDLAVGLNADATTWTQNAARTSIDTLRVDGTLQEVSTFVGPPNIAVSDSRAGIYGQDGWQVFSKLRVQIGFREDFDRIAQRGLVQPRISANYLPFHSNATKLSVGWGRYFQPLDLTLIGQALDQLQSDSFYDPTGTIVTSGPFVSRFAPPAAHLQMPSFDTASAELQQRINAKTFASIGFTDRRGRNGLAYENILPGQQATVFQLESQREDTYRAAEVSLRRQFGEQSEIAFSYVRSRSETNQAIDYALGSIFYTQQLPGPLPWDAPNRVVSHGWTPLPLWHLFGSYFFEYRTGYPFNVVNEQQQLVGFPGATRFPDYVSLNLALEKRFHFKHREWAIRASAENITGHKNPQEVINNLNAPDFLTFAGGENRGFSFRLRLVGEK